MQNSRREPHSSVTVRRLRDVGGKLNFFGKQFKAILRTELEY